jgi:hypothetical protein
MRRLLPLLATAQAYELCIGQDYWSIMNYTAVMGKPACVMSYASLYNLTAALWNGTEYGSGVEHASRLLESLPGADLQLGLWLVGGLDSINNGSWDDAISELVQFVRWAAPRKIYVRIGYEFDNPQNEYDPVSYKEAYSRIADALRDEPNAIKVWHSWSFPETYGGHSYEAWWPGIDKVDYCGVSIFQQAYGDSPMGDLATAKDIARFCRDHKKPLMIAESTPFGVGDAEPRATIWERWYVHVLDFIREEKVVLWCYINDDWDAQRMWTEGGTFWGDSRVEAYADLALHWRRAVLASPTRLVSSEAGGGHYAGAAFVGLCLCALPWLVRRKT